MVAYDVSHRSSLLDISIRAWAPVFPRLKAGTPEFVYDSFYPDGWEARQRADLAEVLDGEPENVDVAVLDGTPVGWACTRLHPEDFMGEIYVLAVDPAHQRIGIARMLMEHAYARAQAAGARMMMVETGDDPGHEPARGLYESDGFVRWPVARYFKDLRGLPPDS
ncbi:GNAT family N-acetyltransferase [Stackebrandtia albiflava]|uniref:GNAT family N-acetyltransferase n=1 Tax=Stackebrandtia albiflava TaxID=406432 RepID=UPI0031E673C2